MSTTTERSSEMIHREIQNFQGHAAILLQESSLGKGFFCLNYCYSFSVHKLSPEEKQKNKFINKKVQKKKKGRGPGAGGGWVDVCVVGGGEGRGGGR